MHHSLVGNFPHDQSLLAFRLTDAHVYTKTLVILDGNPNNRGSLSDTRTPDRVTGYVGSFISLFFSLCGVGARAMIRLHGR
ncbi:hypothetical protein HDG34_006117 [Paraburkholderia sp. HC6.4b]|nr:hypothetical protein [Paraburkholderia sp. HC6.4b]MBB5454213.1 hypothetical protein [Paraburkholderia sp. Kb1A]